MKIIKLLLLLSLLFCGCSNKDANQTKPKKVLTGADILISENLDLIKGKKLGIITNHTAILSDGTHLVDTLANIDGISIKALFGPEHGIRGDASAGEKIGDNVDAKTGIPVYSLYGKNRKPTKEMLGDINMLIFDIQDIGARFYTYISTLYKIIETSKEHNIDLIVLDRPNPIGGTTVDGPLIEEELFSFVGINRIPIQHGMTIGELAKLFSEKFIKTKDEFHLKIIRMQNWQRDYIFSDCGLPWIKPSPNIPNLETALIYPGTCLLEGTNISEGRGTYSPFLTIGAPFINSKDLSDLLKAQVDSNIVEISDTSFVTEKIPNMALWVKFEGEKSNGIHISIKNEKLLQPLRFGVKLIYSLHKLYKDEFEFKDKWIDKLYGNPTFKDMIRNNKTHEEIIATWNEDIREFKSLRKNYLLY